MKANKNTTHQSINDFSFGNSFARESGNQLNGAKDDFAIPSKEDMDARAAELTEQMDSMFCTV